MSASKKFQTAPGNPARESRTAPSRPGDAAQNVLSEPLETVDKSARCLLVRAGKVLLVTHSNCSPPNRGKWALPGGRLEDGESPRRTLRRELREELDLDIEGLREVGRYVSRERWHRVYWAECVEGPERWDPAEIEEVRWFDPEDVAGLEADERLHYGFEAEVVADWREAVRRVTRPSGPLSQHISAEPTDS